VIARELLLQPSRSSLNLLSALNELVNGKRGVTADSALDLAHALGTSPEQWLNLQMQFDLRRAEERRKRAS
jgi:addiction module HigA family antidote